LRQPSAMVFQDEKASPSVAVFFNN
jgi:hypothetical protein